MSMVVRVQIAIDVDDAAGLTNLITLDRSETVPAPRLGVGPDGMMPLAQSVVARNVEECEKLAYEQMENLGNLK